MKKETVEMIRARCARSKAVKSRLVMRVVAVVAPFAAAFPDGRVAMPDDLAAASELGLPEQLTPVRLRAATWAHRLLLLRDGR